MSDSNLISFGEDLAKFAEKIDVAIAEVTKIVAIKIHDGVVKRTPVDTGRARAGWALSVGSPSTYRPPPSTVKSTGQPGTGAPRDPQFSALPAADVAGIDGTARVFIVNNVEYIQFLEEGHSKQAPAGMARLTVQAIESEIAAELAKMAK